MNQKTHKPSLSYNAFNQIVENLLQKKEIENDRNLINEGQKIIVNARPNNSESKQSKNSLVLELESLENLINITNNDENIINNEKKSNDNPISNEEKAEKPNLIKKSHSKNCNLI